MFPIASDTLFEAQESRSLDASQPGDLVSVVVTLFEDEGCVAECLDSVVAQHHPSLELIIVDDGSTDETAAAAREWLKTATRFDRSILLRHTRNQGLSQARNTGIDAARANHVFVLDGGGLLYPRAIGRLLESIEETQAGVAYSQIEIFGERHRLGSADEWRREFFAKGNYVDAMALISKAAWSTVGGYTPMDPGWGEYEFWCKFIEHGIPGIFVPEILCRRRFVRDGMSEDEAHARLSRMTDRMLQLHPWVQPSTAAELRSPQAPDAQAIAEAVA